MGSQFAFSGLTQAMRDFRGTSWGMSKEEVKFSENLVPLSEGEGFITYSERVMGLDAVVGFHFLEDSLVEAGYAFRESLGCEHLYIKEYRKLKGLLMGSHGKPSYDEKVFGEYGCFHVRCSGEECGDKCPPIYLCEWMTPRSVIRLVLMGKEKGFDFGLLHMSKEHEVLRGGKSV